jgi:hypothetical protein
MNKLITLIFLVSTIFLFQSCTNTSVCCDPVEEIPTRPVEFAPKNYERLNFTNLQIGQISLFDETIVQNWRNDDSKFTKTNDTLQLKVIGKDSNGFKIETHIIDKRLYYYQFYVKIIGDSLYINPTNKGEKFFGGLFFYSPFAYPLNEQGLTKWTTNKWQIPQKVVFGRSFGFKENAIINGTNYSKIIGDYDDSGAPSDGPIFLNYYSKEKGFIGFYILTSYFGSDGKLWNLIP